MIERALGAVARLVGDRPRTVLAVCAGVTLLALALLPGVRVASDVGSFLPEGDERVALHRSVGAAAAASRDLYLILEGEELEARLPELAERLRASPFLERVAATKEELLGDLRGQLEGAPLPFLSERALDELEGRLQGEGRRAALEESLLALREDPIGGRELLMRDPLNLRWILRSAAEELVPAALRDPSPFLLLGEGRMALVSVRGREEPTVVDYSMALMADLESRLAGEELSTLGGYATARSDATRIEKDIKSSTIASFLLVVLFLTLSTRSLLAPHLFVLPVGLAILWAIVFGDLLIGPLTPLALSATAVLMGLGVDYTIHYAERYREALPSGGAEGARRVAGVRTGRASFLALLTSFTAFLGLTLCSFPELRKFGALLALGLGLAFLLALFLFPLLARWLPPRSASKKRRASKNVAIELACRVTRGPSGRRLALSILALAALGWAGLLARGIEFDADPSHLRPASDPSLVGARRLQGELGFSPLAIQVLVPAVASLESIEDACRRLREEGVIALDLGPHRAWVGPERRARLERFYAATRGWVEGALGDLEALGVRPEPMRASLEEWSARLKEEPHGGVESGGPESGQVQAGGKSYWQIALHPTGDQQVEERRREVHRALAAAFESSIVLDPFGMSELVLPILKRELGRVLLGTGIGVALLVLLFVRSVRGTLLALLPVLSGFGLFFGLLTLLRIPLHPGNMIALPLVLGLGVDGGVYLVLRHLEGAPDPLAAVGPAIWKTNGTTFLGFGSLITATSPAIASMGWLVLLGVAATFLSSVVVLPALLPQRSSVAYPVNP